MSLLCLHGTHAYERILLYNGKVLCAFHAINVGIHSRFGFFPHQVLTCKLKHLHVSKFVFEK